MVVLVVNVYIINLTVPFTCHFHFQNEIMADLYFNLHKIGHGIVRVFFSITKWKSLSFLSGTIRTTIITHSLMPVIYIYIFT